jgi:hypothetical protein
MVGSLAIILYIISYIFVRIHTVCIHTFSIGCAQHLIEVDHMCDSVNDTMMLSLIVTEIRQLNILLKCYVYKKFKETLSDIHVCAKVKRNLLWLVFGWPHF